MPWCLSGIIEFLYFLEGTHNSKYKFMINVLYISYDGITDPLGQSQILPYIKGLSDKGYQIVILSFEKKERFEKQRQIIYNDIENCNIVWHPQIYTAYPPVISTLLDLRRMKKEAAGLHKKYNFKIIHTRSYIPAIAALSLKQKFDVPYIFDIRGFWVDERIEGGIWNLKNPIYYIIFKYFKKKEKQLFANAKHIVSLTEKGKKIINSWNITNDIPISVIPCCVDLNHFNYSNINEEATNKLKEETGISQQDFVISYVGSIGTWYMLEEMLDFFIQLKKKIPKALFLFITQDNPDLIYNIVLQKRISKNSIIIKPALRKDVPLYLSLSDISIFFIKPLFSKNASSPTKMGEILGMGKPIITNTSVGDIDSIVKESNCGILLNDFTTQDFNYAIDKIEDIMKLDKEHFRNVSKKNYLLEDGIKKYEEIYNLVCNE